MKTINVAFEEGEYQKLLDVKDGNSWHDFIIECSKLKELDNIKNG